MDNKYYIAISLLGQSGCRLCFPKCTLYIDPYLSNSVQETEAKDLTRLVPITLTPDDTNDADWLLITHEHIDHCDPHTIPQMVRASPNLRLMGPYPVISILRAWGIPGERLVLASESWHQLTDELRVHPVPAAHPKILRNAAGDLSCVGYLLDYRGRLIYHAGDTSLCQEVIDGVTAHGSVHTAFLPVNEHNFFRGRRGIIGNMSVREAFGFALEIGAQQIVPVHWDMFAANETTPDEIRAVYRRLQPDFGLLFRPNVINLANSRISIIIRTLNEAKNLGSLLEGIASQQSSGVRHEVIVVDSGSTDSTLAIAESYGCRILHIARDDFSFGRSLNFGCQAAQGDILVLISGHCVPTNEHWLQQLCQPLLDDEASYSYGRQLGGDESHYSEQRIFAKYFPGESRIGPNEYFCNNANAALRRSDWERFRFDEDITGLEDMELAKRLVSCGGKVIYVPEAAVYHYHQESWKQIQQRFERESLALKDIMPQVHVNLLDFTRYVTTSVLKDWHSGLNARVWRKNALDIFRYRWHQYRGVYRGNNQHRKLSHVEKEKYFYPQ